MLTYFGIWMDGSSYSSIEQCCFVTQDRDECLKKGTDLMTGFITSGPDDNQRVKIVGIDLTKRQYQKLLKCVDKPDFDFIEDCYLDGDDIMEYNYSDRDEFYI